MPKNKFKFSELHRKGLKLGAGYSQMLRQLDNDKAVSLLSNQNQHQNKSAERRAPRRTKLKAVTARHRSLQNSLVRQEENSILNDLELMMDLERKGRGDDESRVLPRIDSGKR
jgi:hypothetical protein